MPDSVSRAEFDVVHLLRQVGGEGRAPDSLIDVLRDSEGPVDVACVFDRVKTGLAHGRKVEMGVLIPHPFAPRCYLTAENLLVISLRCYAEHSGSLGRVI